MKNEEYVLFTLEDSENRSSKAYGVKMDMAEYNPRKLSEIIYSGIDEARIHCPEAFPSDVWTPNFVVDALIGLGFDVIEFGGVHKFSMECSPIKV